MRYTPEIVDALKPNEVFVFGSNESGIHGAGAARVAYDAFGAEWGIGWGLVGDTFAIPTKDWQIAQLDLATIGHYVARFVAFTKTQPNKVFLVTKIGCGLAGFTIEQIAPLFRQAKAHKCKNIVLPKEFVDEVKDFERRAKLP